MPVSHDTRAHFRNIDARNRNKQDKEAGWDMSRSGKTAAAETQQKKEQQCTPGYSNKVAQRVAALSTKAG